MFCTNKFLKNLEDISLFLQNHCFGLLMTSPLGFKVKVGRIFHTWQKCVLHAPWDSPDLLAATMASSMAAQPFSSMDLQAGMGGRWGWLKRGICHATSASQRETRQGDTLLTELCWLCWYHILLFLLWSLKYEPYFVPISFRYGLILPNGYGFAHVDTRSSRPHWFHVVLNIIGPNNGQGFRVYHDGIRVRLHCLSDSDAVSDALLRNG